MIEKHINRQTENVGNECIGKHKHNAIFGTKPKLETRRNQIILTGTGHIKTSSF